MAMQMKDREDDDALGCCNKIHAIGEAPKEGALDTGIESRELLRGRTNSGKKVVQSQHELGT